MDFFRRFAGPVIGFLAAAGLQVSGIEAFPVALGIWGLAALWALFALITWPPVARWLPSVSVTWPAFQPSAPEQAANESPVPVAKGFLDFKVDVDKASKEFAKSIKRLNQRTDDLREKLLTQAKRFAAARGDAGKSRKVASDMAKAIDEYAAFIEGRHPERQAIQKLFTESWLGYLETSPEFRNKARKGDLESLRSKVEDLRKTAGTNLEAHSGLQNALLNLRQTNISQRVNSATDRLVEDLIQEASEMKELEAALQRIGLLSTTRLQEMG